MLKERAQELELAGAELDGLVADRCPASAQVEGEVADSKLSLLGRAARAQAYAAIARIRLEGSFFRSDIAAALPGGAVR